MADQKNQGKFKKKLTLLDMTFLGCGSIIGSGWLFGAMNAGQLAGPLAWIPWFIGAFIFLLIGMNYAELSAAMPRTGGFLRYPDFTHGNMVGYLIGFSSLLGYTSVIGVEVIAARQYADYYIPALSNADNTPTLLGFIVQAALVVLFFLINYWSVNFFGKFNTLLTFFKFIVPILIIIILFMNMNPSNFTAGGADPGGIHGIFKSVVAAGIAFAFLGFRQAVDFGAEARRPQKDIPLAIILSIVICVILYVLLQIAYIGAIPADVISNGWASINWSSPWAKLAQLLGAVWLANIVLVDAAISPSATGNIFLSGTARMMFAFSKNGFFYSIFAKVNKKTGVPRASLWLAMIMGILWTLPGQFQTWSGLVGAVTSAFVLTYMTGPVSVGALRKRKPDMHRPFFMKGSWWISPLAFAAAALVALWSGFQTLITLIPIIVASLLLFFAFIDKNDDMKKKLKEDVMSCLWLFGFYAFMLIISWMSSYGPGHIIPGPWDSVITGIGAIGIYYWGVHTSLKEPRIAEEPELQIDPNEPV